MKKDKLKAFIITLNIHFQTMMLIKVGCYDSVFEKKKFSFFPFEKMKKEK